MRKDNPNPRDDAYEMALREYEATVQLIMFLYSLLLNLKDSNYNLYSVSYLLDLACTRAMAMLGGDGKEIEEIRKVAKEELDNVLKNNKQEPTRESKSEVDRVKEELKKMGINCEVLYDPKTKITYPYVTDISKFISQKQIDEWMRSHMDEILDKYIERKKPKKDGPAK